MNIKSFSRSKINSVDTDQIECPPPPFKKIQCILIRPWSPASRSGHFGLRQLIIERSATPLTVACLFCILSVLYFVYLVFYILYLVYSCPCLVVEYTEELISRTFLGEIQFRLVSQDRVSA